MKFNGWKGYEMKRRQNEQKRTQRSRHLFTNCSKLTTHRIAGQIGKGVTAFASRPTMQCAGYELQGGIFKLLMQLAICEAACERKPLDGNWQARVGLPASERGTLAPRASDNHRKRERATPKVSKLNAPEIQLNATT